MRRQLIWLVAIVLAAAVLVAALRALQISRTGGADEQESALAGDLPYDIGSRGVPSLGGESLVLAPEVGAVSQLTVDGEWREVVGYCSQVNPAARFLMCRASGMSEAPYVRLTIYEFDNGTRVTLATGYFGTADAGAVLSEADINARATQVFGVATDTANIRQNQRATAEANRAVAVATQTAVVAQSTDSPNPDAQEEVEQLLDALETTVVAADARIATAQPPAGTPIPQPTAPAVVEASLTAQEALQQMFEDTSEQYSIGYFSLGPNTNTGYFYARLEGGDGFVWRNGDWVYQATSQNEQALDYFVEVFPY